MHLTRTFGRWQIELHQRSIYLTRQPDPNCPDCAGERGGWTPHDADVDWNECGCLDQLRTWRLPLWRRPTHHYAQEPF